MRSATSCSMKEADGSIILFIANWLDSFMALLTRITGWHILLVLAVHAIGQEFTKAPNEAFVGFIDPQ